MSSTDQIRRLLLGGLDFLGDYEMLKAKVSRLADQIGISLEIPERPGVEVTPEIRAYILASRERCAEEAWLLNKGIRDQICVRFGLSRSQVAGVLSGASRRNGNRNGVGYSPEGTPDPAPAQTQIITQDQATWPAYNGSVAPPNKPTRGLDETDWQIAKALIAVGQWDQKRGLIPGRRGLTSQQVAGMKAVLSRRSAS